MASSKQFTTSLTLWSFSMQQSGSDDLSPLTKKPLVQFWLSDMKKTRWESLYPTPTDYVFIVHLTTSR